MTIEELKKVPFKMVSHISLAKHHEAVYISEGITPPIYAQTICRIKKNGDFGRSIKRYNYQGVIYKNVEQLLNAINGTEQSDTSSE